MARPRRAQADDQWYLSAGALLLGGPFWYALEQGGYPLAAPEAFALPAGIAAVGAALALGVRRCPEPFRTLLFAAMVVIFVELQFDVKSLSIGARAAIVVVACGLLVTHRAQVTTVAVVAFLAAGLWRPSGGSNGPRPMQAAAAGGPPLIVHLILDAQWGPGGFRSAGDTATADFMAAFYRRWGFTLYEGAYSRYSATRLSLGSEFGLQVPSSVDLVATDQFRLKRNPYFEYLEGKGYQIWAYQTSHLDFCSSIARARCITTKSNQIGNIGYLPGRWLVRAWLAGRYVLATHVPWVQRRLRLLKWSWRRSVTGGALQVAATAGRDLAAHGGPGQAFVVHLLLPHPPFDVDEHCQAFPSVAARDRANTSSEGPTSWMPPLAGATRCGLEILDALFAKIDSMAGPQRSIIIVQGDHGPRLPTVPGQTAPTVLADYDPATLTNHFSTLFAVRLPNVAPSVISSPAPIQDLLWDLVADDFTVASTGPWPDHVMLSNRPPVATDTLRPIPPADMLWIRPVMGSAIESRP